MKGKKEGKGKRMGKSREGKDREWGEIVKEKGKVGEEKERERDAKPPQIAIFPKFSSLWCSCTHPIPDLWAHGILFHAKFHHHRHILLYITTHDHAKITNVGNVRGLLHPHPWIDPRQIWLA